MCMKSSYRIVAGFLGTVLLSPLVAAPTAVAADDKKPCPRGEKRTVVTLWSSPNFQGTSETIFACGRRGVDIESGNYLSARIYGKKRTCTAYSVFGTGGNPDVSFVAQKFGRDGRISDSGFFIRSIKCQRDRN